MGVFIRAIDGSDGCTYLGRLAHPHRAHLYHQGVSLMVQNSFFTSLPSWDILHSSSGIVAGVAALIVREEACRRSDADPLGGTKGWE